MAKDLPYRAEYAKSGRAGCKSCKSNIAQDSLRIARMVQSPHFDGKMPMWYHYTCFFKKFKPSSSKDIDNFNGLRWDDQEKVNQKLVGTTDSSTMDAVDGKDNNMNDEFCVEYAKSSRATCKGCELKIEKNELRLAKQMTVELESQNFAVRTVPYWYHAKCFLQRKPYLKATDLRAPEVPGFITLNQEDKDMLIKEMGGKREKSSQDSAANKKKGKGKAKSKKTSADEKPAVKTSEDDKLKIELKNQTEEFWNIRDQIFKTCSNALIREILELNDYDSTGGETKILDRCADGMMFGALDLCPECEKGRLSYNSDGYHCTGNISSWTRCIYSTLNPKRKVWVISNDLKEDNDFLNKFMPVIKERKFPKDVVENFNKKEEESHESPSLRLVNKTIIIVGRLKKSKAVLTSKIEELGGSLIEKANSTCFCCVSSPGEVMKSGKKMQAVEKNNIPVVTEEYLDSITKGGAEAMLTQYAIAPWGSDRGAIDTMDGTMTTKTGSKRKNLEKSSSESSKKAKMTMKGGAVVDPASGKEDTCHVLTIGKDLYTAVLGMVDLSRGTNSYYKLQVLEHDERKNKYFLFRAWGRVGTSVGGDKIESFSNKEDAVDHFQVLYEEKTGNQWYNRKNFVKRPNKFYPLDIDYGQDDEVLQNTIAPGSISKLTNPVKELIKLIFDVEAMNHALVEFEIDLKKMPLGKLSRKQIETAYACLGECQQYMTDGIKGSKILDASNRFFTLIPHDFGLRKPPLLNDVDLITSKIQMLDSLLEIEIAYSLMKGSKADGKQDPLDLHYESLKTEIHELQHDASEFSMVKDYVKNTHAKTHSGYTLEVQDVFAIDRQGEKQRYRPFKELHNRKLLWHGSRTTNYAGILSQGLRIAPPEAPVTGYMFGKGVYFADMASKSANYCHASRSSNTALMLLCEVALGNTYELTAAKHITKLPAGKHSCKGLGRTAPDMTQDKTLQDGVVVPFGKGQPTNVNKSSLLYNEYIVYDVAQINMKYLVKVKFNYKY